MAKYKLTESGVQDTETGAFIPNAPGNRHWTEYQEWLLEPGNVPDPMYSGAELKAQKKAWITAKREEVINGGITFEGHTYQTDDRSRENVSGLVAAMGAAVPLPANFIFRDANNVDVPMTSTTLAELGGTMIAHVNTAYKTSWTLKAAVDALDENSASLQEDLDAIVWPA